MILSRVLLHVLSLAPLQIAVALMHKMDRAKHTDKAAAAQAFAKALHDAWGVGNPACQNGVLLFVAIGNREVRMCFIFGPWGMVADRDS